MDQEEHDKLEQQLYPDQSITWEYEDEFPATKVLVDVAAGNRTNKMMNVLHLPHDTPEKWMESVKELVIDVAKTVAGESESTSVEMQTGQQHIADWLNNNASQQQLLFFACNHLYSMSIQMAEKRLQQKNPLAHLLSQLGGQ